jgi:hypothetical protein
MSTDNKSLVINKVVSFFNKKKEKNTFRNKKYL